MSCAGCAAAKPEVTSRAVLVVARQAGSAAALSPVVALLKSRGDRVFITAPSQTGRAGFEAAQVDPNVEMPTAPTIDWLKAWLRIHEISGVVTGTSAEPALDRRFWTAAHELSVPAIAVLDHWCNYPERFSDQVLFDSLPDVVAVMDDAAASELLALGLPANRVRVTGHPHLDEIVPVTEGERDDARRKLEVLDDRPIVTFASEPIGDEEAANLGYTQATSLKAICDALRDVEPSALLVVRPHPREDRVVVPSDCVESLMVRAGTSREAIAASDVLTGMTSIMLLEGALAGVRVLSVRPSGKPEPFIEQRRDLIRSVTVSAALPAELRSALMSPTGVRPSPKQRRRAAAQVAALLDELAVRRGASARTC